MIATISDESFRFMFKYVQSVDSNETFIVELIQKKKGIFSNTRKQKLIFLVGGGGGVVKNA